MRLIDADAAIKDARLNYGGVHDAVLMEHFINSQPTIPSQPNAAIETLLAERDAAVEEMHGSCFKCKHFHIGILDFPCTDCRYEGRENDHWEWRGIADLEIKEN